MHEILVLSAAIIRDSVKVTQQIVALLIWVQILVPELEVRNVKSRRTWKHVS